MVRQSQQQNMTFIQEAAAVKSGIPNVVATLRVVMIKPPRQSKAVVPNMRTKATSAIPNVHNPAPEIGIYQDQDLTYRSQDL